MVQKSRLASPQAAGARSTPQQRRKNSERSASTRRLILDATISCLNDWGYGGVTNIKVADAARVSRGAMMHHFPTRQALIVATVEHAHQRLNAFREAEMAEIPPGLPRFRAILDQSLVTQRMPEGAALNEIRIGSRSDAEIREAVTPMMSAISVDYVRMIGRIAREAGLQVNRELNGLIGTVAMATRALAINTFTYPSVGARDNVLWTLRMMREELIARQLGERHAERPAPLPDLAPAR